MEAILAAKFTEFLKNAGGVLAAVAILLAMVTIRALSRRQSARL